MEDRMSARPGSVPGRTKPALCTRPPGEQEAEPGEPIVVQADARMVWLHVVPAPRDVVRAPRDAQRALRCASAAWAARAWLGKRAVRPSLRSRATVATGSCPLAKPGSRNRRWTIETGRPIVRARRP